MSVLIVTWTGDNDSVQHVTRLLTERGQKVLRLDTDLYPQTIPLWTEYGCSGRRRFLGFPQGVVDLDEVRAVWYRRFRAGTTLPASLGDTREACVGESRQTLYGTIASLGCFQLDPLPSVRLADFKELQTELALQVGLEVPRTLFSNDPAAVRRFYRDLDGQVVTKMQSQFAIVRQGQENVVFTSQVEPRHLERLEGLRFAPMVFQEMVPKALELRATVVGRQVFTAAVRTQDREETRVDWRRDGAGLVEAWERYDLPSEQQEALLRLADCYGLNYAAADFIVTPEGRHVFLEINAAGEWFWMQREPRPALPIAQALTELLIHPEQRRPNRLHGHPGMRGCAP